MAQNNDYFEENERDVLSQSQARKGISTEPANACEKLANLLDDLYESDGSLF